MESPTLTTRLRAAYASLKGRHPGEVAQILAGDSPSGEVVREFRLDRKTGRSLETFESVGAGLAPWQSTIPHYPPWNGRQFVVNGWRSNSVVFSAVRLKMDSFAQGTFVVRDVATKQPVSRHRLYDLLSTVTNVGGVKERLRRSQQDLDIFGNAFWELVRDPLGRVVEIWRRHPLGVRIELGEPSEGTGWIAAYWVYVTGKANWVRVPARDIAHWKVPDPGTGEGEQQGLFGTPPLLAARRPLAVDSGLDDLQKVSIQNNAVPQVALVKRPESPFVLNDESAEEARRMWIRHNSGDNRGGVAVTDFEVKVLGMDWRAMDLGAGYTISENRTSSVFGVPLSMIGRSGMGTDPTYSNAQSDDVRFWRATMRPAGSSFAEGLTTYVLPQLPGSNGREVYYDVSDVDALQSARVDLLEKASKIFVSELLPRHSAQALGDHPPEGPNVFYEAPAVNSNPTDTDEEEGDE